jgi:hypothetical protein
MYQTDPPLSAKELTPTDQEQQLVEQERHRANQE